MENYYWEVGTIKSIKLEPLASNLFQVKIVFSHMIIGESN